jgi:[ribosomal protein S5]-alanine N-acetyltransferase
MTVIMETDRLYLCLFDESHTEAAKDFWGDEEVMAMCNGAVPHIHLPKVLERYRQCHEENGVSVYAVKEKESNTVIGAAGFNLTENKDSIELIYHFSKKAWGKGYASEAAKACLEVAKNHGEIRSVFATADFDNLGSLKILEKIGFTQKGTKWCDILKHDEPYYEYQII